MFEVEQSFSSFSPCAQIYYPAETVPEGPTNPNNHLASELTGCCRSFSCEAISDLSLPCPVRHLSSLLDRVGQVSAPPVIWMPVNVNRCFDADLTQNLLNAAPPHRQLLELPKHSTGKALRNCYRADSGMFEVEKSNSYWKSPASRPDATSQLMAPGVAMPPVTPHAPQITRLRPS